MSISDRPPAAASPVADAQTASQRTFEYWVAQLDELQALRMRDPEEAMTRVQGLQGQWQHLPAPQAALLDARRRLQLGAAALQLGRHAQAQAELTQVQQQLAHPMLAEAEPELRRRAQRCGIAAANAQAVLSHALGDFAGALRAYLHALDLAVVINDLRYQAHVRVNLANTYEECGLPAESLAQSRQALAMARQLQMDELVGDIHHNIGNALAASGDAAAGLVSNRLALQQYSQLQLPQKESYALVAVAERLLELGRPDEARAELAERSRRAQSFVNQQYEAYAAYLQGRIASAQGQPERARAAFLQALAISSGQLDDKVNQARACMEIARLDLQAHALALAHAQATRALQLLAGSQAQRDEMQAHRLLSSVCKAQGDIATALQHHEAFHAGYERCFNEESALKARLLAVRHEVDLARAEAERHRVENARLTDALAAIGARLQRGGAVNAGISNLPGDGPTRPEDLQSLGLTPREAEVLYWVSQGKTNEDVMTILGSSVSAVKKHLARIYEKLGVENRTAAANAARRGRPRA